MITQEMLTHLVQQLDTSVSLKALQETTDAIDEVILESEIDGIRYYLARCRPKSQSRICLSPRERAIAKLVAQGLPNKHIGHRLDISPWTVATHLRRIFAKLGVTSRTAMITQLIQENLLQD
ncbi:MAG TPA: helix-turn-helix transcriptional regulator [Cyanobacteria bacterium UBA8803]|nr:helix-turn-helix transcriptional regulator [Cyanobacteria bacterium UBA9273]HBL60874.1 helix-turn-helix transcriptional regulator [Cyanobacteria bacterium UBA8803]